MTKIFHRTSYVVYAICIMPSMPKYYVSVTTHTKRRQIKDILVVSADQDQRTSFFLSISHKQYLNPAEPLLYI